MTSTTGGSESDPGSIEPVECAARALSVLNEAQLRSLFDHLLEIRRRSDVAVHRTARDSTLPEAAGLPEAQSESLVPKPTIDSQPMGGLRARMLGVGAMFAAGFQAARSIFRDRDVWKNGIANAIPWGIALMAAPFVVPWSFDRDRAAAKPHLSLEYALLQPVSAPLTAADRALIAELGQNPLYRPYTLAHAMDINRIDLTIATLQGAESGGEIRERIEQEVVRFAASLEASAAELSAQRESIATLGDDQVRVMLFRMVDVPVATTLTSPHEELRNAITQRLAQVDAGLAAAGRLREQLARSIPEARLRLTILNRGATDGLVRHKGLITYRGVTHTLSRSAPPDANAATVAVPVFQTNQPESEYSAQSVGKVDQDSMAEFWYRFQLGSQAGTALTKFCNPGEQINVTLYDQNNEEVRGRLECNQEGVE